MAGAGKNIIKLLDKELKKGRSKKYVLRLYVAGLSPSSQRAITNIKKLCEKYLPGKVRLSIQDIYKKPIFARNGQILAAPTLVKELPPASAEICRRYVKYREIARGARFTVKGMGRS